MVRPNFARGNELSGHCCELAPMRIGDAVLVQNKHSNTLLKWDKTVTVQHQAQQQGKTELQEQEVLLVDPVH